MDSPDKNQLVGTAVKLIERLQRQDYWVNESTGIGTEYDRLRNMNPNLSARIQDEQLEALYIENDLAATTIDRIPEEAIRQGYILKFDGEKPGEAAELVRWAEEAYEPAKHVLQGTKWARLFGGGSVMIGSANKRDPVEPLEEGGEIEFLRAVARTDMETALWYDKSQDIKTGKYGYPSVFRVSLRTGGVNLAPKPIHETRFHIIQGVLTTRKRFIENNGWGDSVLARVVDVLKRFDGSWMAIMHILTDSSVPVYKIKDLMSLLESDQLEALIARLMLINSSKNNMRAIVLDAEDEEYERVTAELTDVAPVLQNTMIRMSAAAKLPVSILFGQAPAGLNASPEGDLRNFYDKVDVERKEVFRPALLRIYRFLLAQPSSPTNGVVPENLSIEFPSLWQADPLQAATLYQMMSTADGVYIANQVMEPEEVAVFRAETAQAFGFPRVDLTGRKEMLEVLNNPSAMMETLPDGSPNKLPGGKNLPSNALRRRGEMTEETGAPSALTVENEPQKASLTGAQIKQMEELALKVGEGLLPTSSAKAIVMASIPIDEAAVDAIFADIDDIYSSMSPKERAEVRARPFGGINAGNDGQDETKPEEEGEKGKKPGESSKEKEPPEEQLVRDALAAFREGKDVSITISEPNAEAEPEPHEG